MPRFKAKAEEVSLATNIVPVNDDPKLDFLAGFVGKTHPAMIARPLHRFSYLAYLFLRSSCFLILFTVLLLLLTAKDTWTWDIPYDLVMARINSVPNAAHISTYLTIPVFGLFVAWRFRDEVLGLLAAGFLFAVHESLWVLFYYLAYWPYLDFSLLTNVLKDVSFFAATIIVMLAFVRYRENKLNLSDFTLPIFFYLVGLSWWFVFPTLYGYPWFPITTINNFKYGQTVYSITPYWGDWWINGIEVLSWVGLFAMFVVAAWRAKR